MSTNLWSQNSTSDTVKIQSVDINGHLGLKNQQSLDSSILSNPQHLNLGDLLSKKSHLFIKSYGIGSLATVSLRGSGSAHTQLNWNGISLNSSMNGSSDLALFPLFFMDEVDVNYGLNSVIDGTGGLGGSVNISTLPEFKKQLSLYTSYQLGSFGHEQLNSKVKIGSQKFQSITKIIYNKSVNNFKYRDLTIEGFPDRTVENASLLQKGIMQNIFLKLNKNQLLEANLWLFDSERNLPPLITLRYNIERQEDITVKGMLKYSKYFEKSILKFTIAYLNDQLFYLNERAGIDSESQIKSLRARFDYAFGLKRIEFQSQIKYESNVALADELIEDVDQNRVELFLSAQRSISKQLKTIFSLRSMHVLYNHNFVLPQLRIDYEFEQLNFKLFALAGKNVKYPSLNDLYYVPSGNVNLKAEESESFEFGSIYQKDIINRKLELLTSTTLFYNNIENYIQWEPTAFGFWQPNNLASVETMGVEIFLEIKQTEGKVKKQLNGTYSYTSSRNFEKQHEFDESRGKQLIYIPAHKGNISLKLGVEEMNISTSYQIIGIRFISSDNEEILPSYSLLDVSASKSIKWRSNSYFEISAGVKNLFNAEYQAIEWRPMPNRNYFIKLVYQFRK